MKLMQFLLLLFTSAVICTSLNAVNAAVHTHWRSLSRASHAVLDKAQKSYTELNEVNYTDEVITAKLTYQNADNQQLILIV